jgi:hypothetical protein
MARTTVFGWSQWRTAMRQGVAFFDLLIDETVFVGHDGVDEFDAAVDRAWVHDGDGALADDGETFVGDPVEPVVFAETGEELGLLAFHLDAEEVDDVWFPVEDLIERAEGGDALAAVVGDEGAWAEEGDFGAEFGEDGGGAAGDAAVEDIADDDDAAPGEVLAEGFLHGEGVEEALSGMGVVAVAGVDDTGGGVAGDEIGDAGGTVADDDIIDLHGLERVDGVDDGFTFDDAAGGDGEVGDVCAEAFGGDFEGRARARAWLVEEREDVAAAEGWDLADGAAEEVLEGAGGGEEVIDFLAGEAFDVEEVFAARHTGSFLF